MDKTQLDFILKFVTSGVSNVIKDTEKVKKSLDFKVGKGWRPDVNLNKAGTAIKKALPDMTSFSKLENQILKTVSPPKGLSKGWEKALKPDAFISQAHINKIKPQTTGSQKLIDDEAQKIKNARWRAAEGAKKQLDNLQTKAIGEKYQRDKKRVKAIDKTHAIAIAQNKRINKRNRSNLDKSHLQAIEQNKQINKKMDNLRLRANEDLKKFNARKAKESPRGKQTAEEKKRIDLLHKEGIVANEISDRYNSFGRAIRMPQEELKKMAQGGAKFTNSFARGALKLKMFTHGLRGFRMEALGVMFAGQNLNKVMMGFLQPAIQARNLTEEWGNTMKKLFLPVIKAIEPIFDKISDWIENMSPAMKMVIGGIVVFLAILGKLGFIFGSFMLAIGSSLMMFPKARTGALKTAAAIATMGKSAGTTTKKLVGLNVALLPLSKKGMIPLAGGGASAFKGLAAAGKTASASISAAFSAVVPVLGITVGWLLAIIAVVAAIGYLIYRMVKARKEQKNLAKQTKKTEKAFKGSGLHAAVKATSKEFKIFDLGLQKTDFLMGISEKVVTGFTSAWGSLKTGVASVLDGIITKAKDAWAWIQKVFGGGKKENVFTPPTYGDTYDKESGVLTKGGQGFSTAFPESYYEDVGTVGEGIVDKVTGFFEDVGTKVKDTAAGVWDWLQGQLGIGGGGDVNLPTSAIYGGKNLYDPVKGTLHTPNGGYSTATPGAYGGYTVVEVNIPGADLAAAIESATDRKVVSESENVWNPEAQ